MDYCEMAEGLRAKEERDRCRRRAMYCPLPPMRLLGKGLDALFGKSRDMVDFVSPRQAARRLERYETARNLLANTPDLDMRIMRGELMQRAALYRSIKSSLKQEIAALKATIPAPKDPKIITMRKRTP